MHSQMMQEYDKRRNALADGLRRLGWEFEEPEATYYFWVKIPDVFGTDSIQFAQRLLREQGLLVTPGIGFGKYGEGYIRISINISQSKIHEALKRMETLCESTIIS
ncbi:LL-diaminopimelate aminotransferase [compost metagenome]